jgi:hypothetical protein
MCKKYGIGNKTIEDGIHVQWKGYNIVSGSCNRKLRINITSEAQRKIFEKGTIFFGHAVQKEKFTIEETRKAQRRRRDTTPFYNFQVRHLCCVECELKYNII